MKLIEFKNNELTIADEAYHIRVFKTLWDRDITKDKSRALSTFGFMYFYHHPNSDYNYIIDDDEKIQAIQEGLGIDNLKFLQDKNYLKAVEVYKKMVVTTSSKILETNRNRMEKLGKFLDDLVITDENMNKYTKAISDINKLGVEIAMAEKEIFRDIEEQTAKVRGKVELTVGDML